MDLRELAHLKESADGKLREELKIRFPGLEEEEKITLFFRRHPLSFFNFGLIGSVMVILPAIIILMVFNAGLFALEGPLETKIVLALASAYLLFVLGLMLVGWMNFYLDVYIVTNRRLIDISQEGLFSRNLSAVDLADIEDVKADVKGFLPTYFNFGNVDVQTAGELQNVKFIDVPEPYKLARKIMDEKEKLMERQSAQAVKKVAEKETEAEKATRSSKEYQAIQREKEGQPEETKETSDNSSGEKKQKDRSEETNEDEEDSQKDQTEESPDNSQNKSLDAKELEKGGKVDL
jgi:membrane protein YdbS with pleckstrin-like domain